MADSQLEREMTNFCRQKQIGRNIATVFRVDCPFERCNAQFFNAIPLEARKKYGYRLKPCWKPYRCGKNKNCRRYF